MLPECSSCSSRRTARPFPRPSTAPAWRSRPWASWRPCRSGTPTWPRWSSAAGVGAHRRLGGHFAARSPAARPVDRRWTRREGLGRGAGLSRPALGLVAWCAALALRAPPTVDQARFLKLLRLVSSRISPPWRTYYDRELEERVCDFMEKNALSGTNSGDLSGKTPNSQHRHHALWSVARHNDLPASPAAGSGAK
jgi:hypothetical protein